MVYYQQQSVALLAQISKQVSSIAPQVSIPSSLPPPYPNFTPNSSDIRVNVYWFMSLVFSLSAALLATLVQQWVRDYMQVFERYGNPLKGARLRQYLYEGAEGWYMLVVAESVPSLVHVSLFLFFVGLIDELLSLNTTVGITTIVPITICGLFYVLSTFARIIDPQSPFQTPLSSLFWYLARKLHPRTYLDRASGGALKTVSSNMSEGQMQLAMEENENRKRRDVRAMQWLIDNRTEDDEMDSFVAAIPGAFTSKWGIEVWRMVADDEGANSRPDDATVRPQTDADLQVSVPPHHGSPLPQHTRQPRSPLRFFRPFPGTPTVNIIPDDVTLTRSISHARNDAARDLVIFDLCKRVRRLLDTCESISKLSTRKRARGCVETVASLVLCANVNPEPFGGLERLLRKLGEMERIREISAAGTDGSFVTRWACLYLVVVTRRTLNHPVISARADSTIKLLSEFRLEDDSVQANIHDVDEKALGISRRIDNYFETARKICLKLGGVFRPDQEGWTKEQVREVLARDHEADISKLESAIHVSGQMESIDMAIARINHAFGYSLLPGVSFDEFKKTELIQPLHFFNILAEGSQKFMPQFVFLNQRLRLLCSYTPKLRDIINGRGDDGVCQETLDSLGILWNYDDPSRSVIGRHRLMERQLWRLLDIRDGHGFGFFVELYFLMLAQLLSTANSKYTHSALYIGTFRAITSSWREHKDSIGTQRVILNLICDIAIPDRGVISNNPYPEFITNELLVLLGYMVEGQSGSHIDDTIGELGQNLGLILSGNPFASEAMAVLSGRRTQARRSVLSFTPHGGS
jgi:hypothetical protein